MMTTLNSNMLQQISTIEPTALTEEQKQYLRSITSVNWEEVNLNGGSTACAWLGEDPRTEKGKRIIIGISLMPYFKQHLNRELLSVINHVIESWCAEGIKIIVLAETDEEIDKKLTHNRSLYE